MNYLTKRLYYYNTSRKFMV